MSCCTSDAQSADCSLCIDWSFSLDSMSSWMSWMNCPCNSLVTMRRLLCLIMLCNVWLRGFLPFLACNWKHLSLHWSFITPVYMTVVKSEQILPSGTDENGPTMLLHLAPATLLVTRNCWRAWSNKLNAKLLLAAGLFLQMVHSCFNCSDHHCFLEQGRSKPKKAPCILHRMPDIASKARNG